MRAPVLLALAFLSACGPPGGASFATFAILSEGTGDPVVTRVPHGPGHRWQYELVAENAFFSRASFVWNEGTVQLPSGAVADRRITNLDVAYIQGGDDGEFLWGSDTQPLLDRPIVMLSLPLRLGKTWTTGDDDIPDWYRFEVETVETLDTPAGRLVTARVQQLNSRTGEVVARWYADGIGMVQRVGRDDESGGTTRTRLLAFARAGEAP